MRCANHPDRDAVGVCLGCGAGVCTSCRVSIGGLTYCSACLEAGRYRPPRAARPNAGPAPAVLAGMMVPGVRNQLALGVIGLLMFGIALHLSWISSLAWAYVETFAPVPWSTSPVNPLSVASSVVTGISIALVGLAFSAYARVSASRLCQGTAIVSFVSAWWLPIAGFLQFTGLVWRYGYSPYYIDYQGWIPGPLYYPYTAIMMIGLAFEGLTLLYWASAFIATRHLTRQPALAIASAVHFLIAAHLLLLSLPFNAMLLLNPGPYYYPYYSFHYFFYGVLLLACLVEPACILGALLVYRLRGSK